MVFAAVPKDITIEKLTVPEKRALDEYLGKETRKSILERIAGNEKVPTLIAGTALLVSAPTILKIIFEALAKQKPEFDIDTAAVNYGIFVKDFAEGFFELTGAGTFITPGGSPFAGEAKDFWDKYVKK
jgi:hypothetical protein